MQPFPSLAWSTTSNDEMYRLPENRPASGSLNADDV